MSIINNYQGTSQSYIRIDHTVAYDEIGQQLINHDRKFETSSKYIRPEVEEGATDAENEGVH